MAETELGAARIFADHYQFVVAEDLSYALQDAENWTQPKIDRGYAGAPAFRMIGTEADLNDHWIKISIAQSRPEFGPWDRVICCDFQTRSGQVALAGLMDQEPAISALVVPGTYALYVLGRSLGVDLSTTGELDQDPPVELSDQALAARVDLEHYHVVLVAGAPAQVGVLHNQRSG